MRSPDPAAARALLMRGLGRRGFLRAATAVSAAGAGAVVLGSGTAAAAERGVPVPTRPLQPGSGRIDGDHYLPSTPHAVRWGYVPAIGSTPSLRIRSGETVTIDTVSHEGILEDQGRDPVTYFGSKGVPESGVLTDAIAVARDYRRTPRNFDVDGPHVITGPVYVEGAKPGDGAASETVAGAGLAHRQSRCAAPWSTRWTSSSTTRAWTVPPPTPTCRRRRTSPSRRWWTAPSACTRRSRNPTSPAD